MTIETFVIAILPSLCVSIIMALFNHKQIKRDEAFKEKERQKKTGETVQLSLLIATAKLSYAVAMAIKNGHPNGEVEEGVAQYKEAMSEFKAYERELVAQKSTEQ